MLKRSVKFLLICSILFLFAPVVFAEDITITTYYPSPYGVYNELRFFPHHPHTTACNAGTKGSVAYDDTVGDERLEVCSPVAGTYAWRPLEGLWKTINAAGDIRTVTGTRFVGINKDPGFRLDVGGTVHADGGTDLAEGIVTDSDVEAGDLVVINMDKPQSVKKSSIAYDVNVAGIISTKPGLLIGQSEAEGYKPLALVGQVPCNVNSMNGPIKIGDLLVSSSQPGYAMKAVFFDYAKALNLENLKSMLKENEKRRRAIFGKALESLDKGEGQIVVLIAR